MSHLQLAQTIVRELGPAPQASDVGDLRLAFAQANADTLAGGWCTCTEGGKRQQPQEVYFRRPSGSHGWMCTCCRRITQTG